MGIEDDSRDQLSEDILSYYQGGGEAGRLFQGTGQLELTRTQALTRRYLPPPPGKILDVGGGSGVYAAWLANLGYRVHLIDPVPLHLEQARKLSASQPEHPITRITKGDARQLEVPEDFADGVLLFGPLYHLTAREDRLKALHEARRVVRPGGIVLAVGISRFASALNGVFLGLLKDPQFAAIVQQDLIDGQHRNLPGVSEYFTTAFFHHPDELEGEINESGLDLMKLLPIEGVGVLLDNFAERWDDLQQREWILDIAGSLEEEPSVLGITSHIMAVARKVS